MTTDTAHYQRQWRRRRRAARRQICASCGEVFVPGRRDQVFCSPACKTRDARRRKASGEAPGQRPPKPPFRIHDEPAAPTPRRDDLARRRSDFLASLIG